MIKLITKADQFGASYRPTFNSKDAYKTFFGGIITITLYSLCISYMIYMFVQWTTHQILPRSSVSEEVKEYLYIDFDYDLIEIKLSNDVDPFKKTGNILVPQFFILTNQIKSSAILTFPDSNGWIIPKNYHLLLSTDTNIDVQIQFMACSEQYITTGMTCASDDEITDFFNSKSTITVVVYVTKYNVMTEEFYRIPKKLEFIIQKEQTIFNTYSLQTSYSTIDNGVVFPRNNIYQYIYDYSLSSQSLQLNTQQSIYNVSIYAQFTFTLDNIQQINYLTYPHLDEVLASIGSIWSLILICSYGAVLFNEFRQQEYLYRKIISFYYPQFKYLTIKYNFIGKIIKVEGYGQNYDSKEFSNLYEKLKKQAQTKVKVKNILYELSRLQFIVHSMQERSLIMNSHNVGIKLKILDKYHSEFPEDPLSELLLNSQDFSLLTKPKLIQKTNPFNNQFYSINLMNGSKQETQQVNTSQDKFQLIV